MSKIVIDFEVRADDSMEIFSQWTLSNDVMYSHIFRAVSSLLDNAQTDMQEKTGECATKEEMLDYILKCSSRVMKKN